MKRSIRAILAFYLLAPRAAATRPAPAAADQAVLRKQMTAEIKRLRLEIIEQAIEFQSWKLKRLEGELLATRRELQRMRELESALQHSLADLEAELREEISREKARLQELQQKAGKLRVVD